MRDREDEGSQRVVVTVEAVQPFEDGQEDLAGHVLRLGPATTAQVAGHGGAVPLPDLGERPRLTGPGRDDEVAVPRVRPSRAHGLIYGHMATRVQYATPEGGYPVCTAVSSGATTAAVSGLGEVVTASW